jgi:hypothetical protein
MVKVPAGTGRIKAPESSMVSESSGVRVAARVEVGLGCGVALGGRGVEVGRGVNIGVPVGVWGGLGIPQADDRSSMNRSILRMEFLPLKGNFVEGLYID